MVACEFKSSSGRGICPVEPLTTKARPVSQSRHRIQDDTGMLGWPVLRVRAVDRFVGSAQVFALAPKPSGNVDAGRHALEVDPFCYQTRRK